MSSCYGERIKLSIFGQSHSPAVGMSLDGIPAGLAVDKDLLQKFLDRRSPGKQNYTTSRTEADIPDFISGLVNNHTCGAPICAIISNLDARSSDYENILDCPRPGHSDYTAQIKYNGFQDNAGGGHFSGRLTAPLCVAGGLCLQWLSQIGIQIRAHISSIASIHDSPLDPVNPDLSSISSAFPVIDSSAGNAMQDAIISARHNGDSLGGVIECVATGVPAGLGDPMFYGMENRISQIVFGIPGVKGIEFGNGFSGSTLLGSENNDPFFSENGTVKTITNNCGGILGGITDGMPLVFRTAFKPTPSIAVTQKSIRIRDLQPTELTVHGRHDPCIVPRAVPVIEAAAAIAIFDAWLCQNK